MCIIPRLRHMTSTPSFSATTGYVKRATKTAGVLVGISWVARFSTTGRLHHCPGFAELASNVFSGSIRLDLSSSIISMETWWMRTIQSTARLLVRVTFTSGVCYTISIL